MGAIWGTTQSIGDYFSLKQANDSLALENFRLKARMADLEEFISDSIRVSRLPEDGIANGYRYIPATISKISKNTQHNYIIIGKGFPKLTVAYAWQEVRFEIKLRKRVIF